MKIYEWLNDSMSAISAIAVVEVSPNEIADIEKMATLLDGDYVGHFGISVKLLYENIDSISWSWKKLKPWNEESFGHSPISTYSGKYRYYKVHVSRD